MKFFSRHFAVIALAAFGLLCWTTSCKKSNSSSSSGSLSVTLASSTSSGTFSGGTYEAFSHDYLISLIYAENISGDSAYFQVIFPDTLALNKAYTFTGAALALTYYPAGGGETYSDEFGTATGTLTLTALDTTAHKVTGTFTNAAIYGALYGDTLSVTGGKFTCVYSPD